MITSLSARRAWIEIVGGTIAAYPIFPSLSARRAWIEIWASGPHATGAESLSARRAWIEIIHIFTEVRKMDASLSARRAWIEMVIAAVFSRTTVCRSPQGERG